MTRKTTNQNAMHLQPHYGIYNHETMGKKVGKSLLYLTIIFCEIVLSVVLSHPDENLSITQMITKHNYPVEEHSIETSDGYLLSTFRIPSGKDRRKVQPKQVALVVHGLACSADDWVTLGPDALAYYLADTGFDVWLFNARGTRHSRRHKTIDPDKDAREFWDFCWHEIGIYDLPANINYILKHTKAEQLFYIGHSQGGTSCLVMLSELPEMNSKVRAAVLLAPAAYFVNFQDSFALKMLANVYSPTTTQRKLTFYEFPPKSSNANTNNKVKDLCSNPRMRSVCYNSLYFGDPFKGHLIDEQLVPIIVQHTPSTFSTKQVQHYAQIMQTGEFKRFDYGDKLNLKFYGTSKSPFYNISNIRTPLALFYGTGDFLATPMSVKKIGNELTNEHLVYEVPFPGFNHIDFLWARNAKKLLYEKAYDILKMYIN